MKMAKITPTQMDRVNLNLLFNANPIGSEIETTRGIGVVSGIREFKSELVYAVTITNESGKQIAIAVKPNTKGINLLDDPDNIAEVSKATGEVIGILNEALPKSVETKVEAVPVFEFNGPRLRAMRIAAGLTQVFVAEYLGMAKSSSAAIGDWEAERNKVPVKHQAKLIELYTPSPEDELDEEEDEGGYDEEDGGDNIYLDAYNAAIRAGEGIEAAEEIGKQALVDAKAENATADKAEDNEEADTAADTQEEDSAADEASDTANEEEGDANEEAE